VIISKFHPNLIARAPKSPEILPVLAELQMHPTYKTESERTLFFFASLASIQRKAMKQKYHIRKDDKEKTLRIQEFAVLTANTGKQSSPPIQDDDFSLLCEQTYGAKEVKSASSTGKDDLILLLRNQHFFPIGVYMDEIAKVVMEMYASKGEQYEDLVFDDKAVLGSDFSEQKTVAEITDDIEQNPAENLDTLIEGDSK